MKEEVALVTKGCLGTCWYGKYHYVEPWAGCEFDCAYCYARFRSPVTNRITNEGSIFSKPVPLFDEEKLPELLVKEVIKEGVKIAKLSRYTDVFTPSFQKSGLAHRVFKALLESPLERLILTTKGVPDEEMHQLLVKHRDKVSYNLVAKPQTSIQFEGNIPPLKERLEAASRAAGDGICVTIHMDPMVAGIEDGEEDLIKFFNLLKEYKLNRVMFSYLLLNDEIIEIFRERFGDEVTDNLLSYFDEAPRQMLAKQEETAYRSYKDEFKKASIERISRILNEMDFDFVLCSLKSGRGKLQIDTNKCALCDGTFYA